MADVLSALSDDHAQMRWLLDALQRQLEIFRHGGTPDYEIIGGITDYCLSYPDRFHHPKEDAILEYVLARDPEAAAALARLGGEHENLAALTEKFAAALAQVLDDRIVPHAWFDDTAMAFIDAYRNHIEWEETSFFPAALRCLTARDWAALDVRFGAYTGPVPGEDGEERYQALRHELLTLDRDELYQANA